jgi:cytochrome c
MRSGFRPSSLLPLLLLLAACGEEAPARLQVAGGDPEAGRRLVLEYGCQSCHTIPGVVGADGIVGPTLEGFADRVQIAGALPNLPGHLVAWLQDPPALTPAAGMPDMGVSEADARDLAAFLYTMGGEAEISPPIVHPPSILRASVPADRRKELEAAAKEQLGSYGWTDRERGMARIPIDRAMEIIEDGGTAPGGSRP